MIARLVLCLLLLASPLRADDGVLRLAVYTVEMDRTGPGLLLRDLKRGDPEADAVARVIAHADPDVILLLRFDYDADGLALGAFADLLSSHGVDYKHHFALHPNAGRMTDFDLDGDGRLRGPGDAQGYGLFAGQNGMAILSKLPIDTAAMRDFSDFLWRDLPGAVLPTYPDGTPFPSAAAQSAQRLSSIGHWNVPVILPDGGRLHLLAWHATPPVFDGPEDRNGLRNRDEIRFWQVYLDGGLGPAPPAAPFVVLGNANNDPKRGDGLDAAITGLLRHPALLDPRPVSQLGAAGGVPEATVAWDVPDAPPMMRVDYLLPSAVLDVQGAGIVWSAPGPDTETPSEPDTGTGSRHGLVWVDIVLPPPARRILDPPQGSG
ncbi:endonuclease/exonuclease/phosphatase family protein [Meridianimarinicoccus sp. RP-17]|uniref:endonuclease/exonuclease/phosphatase family protein n=1 Tax=Meridianimarinicoccus zhengii TaxID=2056810 RepID=UPI000DACE2C6|nr:endonuclease/exonuclease/phosphatase family protein [Phycocomes zhengii]